MRDIIAIIILALSFILAAYVGLWLMFIDPILYACSCFDAGMLTGTVIGITILKCVFASPVAGIILFIGAGISNIIIDDYNW